MKCRTYHGKLSMIGIDGWQSVAGFPTVVLVQRIVLGVRRIRRG